MIFCKFILCIYTQLNFIVYNASQSLLNITTVSMKSRYGESYLDDRCPRRGLVDWAECKLLYVTPTVLQPTLIHIYQGAVLSVRRARVVGGTSWYLNPSALIRCASVVNCASYALATTL